MNADGKSRRLARRLTLLFMSLAILPLLIGGGVIAYVTYQLRSEEVAERQKMTVALGKTFFSNYIAGLTAELQLADEIALRTPSAPESALEALCLHHPERYPDLVLVDEAGQELAHWQNCQPLPEDQLGNRAEREPFFKAVRDGQYVGKVSFLQDGEPMAPMSVSVVDTTGRKLVLCAVVNLREFWEPLSQLIPEEEGYFYLVDQRGTLIGYEDLTLVQQEISLGQLPTVFPLVQATEAGNVAPVTAAYYRGLRGVEVIGSSALIENVHWGIVVEQPVTLAFMRQGWLVGGLVFLMLVVMGVAVTIALMEARKITGPIGILAEGADSIAQGDFNYTIATISQDEIGAVARAFNVMATRLRELVRNLEQRVQEQREAEASLRRQLKELTALNAIASAAAEAPNETVLVEQTVDLLGTLLDPDSFGIMLIDEAAGILRPHPTRMLAMSAREVEIPLGQGISGMVAQDGRPRRIADVRQESYYWSIIPETRSELCVPLRVGGRVIGVLNAECTRVQAFSEADERLLLTAAGQLATALDRLRAATAEQRRTRELAIIYDVGRRVTSILSLDVLLPQVVELIMRAMEVYNVEIALVEGRELVFRAGYGGYVDGHGRMPGGVLPMGEGISGRVAVSGKKLWVPDVQIFPDYILSESLPNVRCELAVPLRVKDQVIGVLDIKSDQPNGLSGTDPEMVEILADQVAIAIENARYYQKAVEVARRQTVLRWAIQEIVGATLDSERVCQAIHQAAAQLMPSEACVIARLDEERQEIEYLYLVDRGRVRPPMRLPLGSGVAGHVIATGETVMATDLQQLAKLSLHHFGDPEPVQSVLAVPLRLGGRVMGVLSVQSYAVYAYHAEDMGALEMLAAQAAAALENARLFGEERRRSWELETLRQASLQVTSLLELQPTVEAILDQALRLVTADGAQVFFYEHGALRFGAALAAGEATTAEPWARSFTAVVMAKGQPVVVSDMGRDPLFKDGGWNGAVVGLPLRSRDQLRGVMNLYFRVPHRFDGNELRGLELLADQAAIAVENAGLFAEVLQRTEEQAAALERLQEMNRLKSEFIQNVSHELRTPLGIIRGYAELLEGGMLGALQPEQQEPVEIIARRVRMMVKMVEDLTAILTAETRELQREPVDLAEIVSGLAAEFQTQAEKLGLQLEVSVMPELPAMLGDAGHLRRMLDNLVGNAFKFTPAGGRVSVLLGQESDMLVLEVTDTGIGIPTEKLGRIFERFYQVDGSMSRRYGGTGLGLALVKEIVETHGGSVTVSSQLGTGTTFLVRLPLEAGSA